MYSRQQVPNLDAQTPVVAHGGDATSETTVISPTATSAGGAILVATRGQRAKLSVEDISGLLTVMIRGLRVHGAAETPSAAHDSPAAARGCGTRRGHQRRRQQHAPCAAAAAAAAVPSAHTAPQLVFSRHARRAASGAELTRERGV